MTEAVKGTHYFRTMVVPQTACVKNCANLMYAAATKATKPRSTHGMGDEQGGEIRLDNDRKYFNVKP